jgi:PST family polysaccharide transporter
MTAARETKALTEEAVSNVGWQALVMGSNLMLKALVLIALARLMAPSQFGLIAAAMVVISLAADLSQIGVHRALIQRLTLDTAHIRTAFAIALLTGASAAGLLYAAAPVMAGLLGIAETRPLIEFLALTLAITGISEVSAALMQRDRQFRTLAMIDLGSYGLGFIAVALVLAWQGYGAWSLAIGQMAQVCVRLAALFAVRMPAIALIPHWRESKDLLITGAGFSAGQIGNFLATQADYFVVGRFMGAEALGFYSRAYQLFMLPAQMFGKVAATVLFPTFSAIQDQPERIARAYLSALGITSLAILPVSAVLIILAPEMISVLLGPNWSGIIAPFQILVVTLVFRTSYKISDAVILATGSMYRRAVTQYCYAAMVVAGSLAGLRFGLPGVAAGVGAAVLFNHTMTLALARQNTGVTWASLWLAQLRQLPGAALIAAPVWIAAHLARTHAVPDLLVLVAGGAAGLAAGASVWWLARPVFGAEGEWLATMIAGRLAKWKARRVARA